jgi:uncharacterized protein (DUF2249 family)
MQIDDCKLKMSILSNQFLFRISQRCERLSTLFNSINDLDYGEYLLINRDEQMEVVSRDIEDPVEK